MRKTFGRNKLAAKFVTRKFFALNQFNRKTFLGKPNRRARSGGTGANDEDLGF
jgi:hypothetical protein